MTGSPSNPGRFSFRFEFGPVVSGDSPTVLQCELCRALRCRRVAGRCWHHGHRLAGEGDCAPERGDFRPEVSGFGAAPGEGHPGVAAVPDHFGLTVVAPLVEAGERASD